MPNPNFFQTPSHCEAAQQPWQSNPEEKKPESSQLTPLKLKQPRKRDTYEIDSNFQPGDLLFYLPQAKIRCGNMLTTWFQFLLNSDVNDIQITHTAIVVGHTKKDGKDVAQIADITGKGYRVAPFNENQPVLVYRPQDPLVARRIVDEARNPEHFKHKPKWNGWVAAGSLFWKKHYPWSQEARDPYEMSHFTFCSKFVIEVLQKALSWKVAEQSHNYTPAELEHLRRVANSYDLNISTMNLPVEFKKEMDKKSIIDPLVIFKKELDKKDPYTYRLHCYMGKTNIPSDPFNFVKKLIEDELKRLEHNIENDPYVEKNHRKLQKLDQAKSDFATAMFEVYQQKGTKNLDKALILIKRMYHSFSINTGWGFYTTTKHDLDKVARKLYLYDSVIQKYGK